MCLFKDVYDDDTLCLNKLFYVMDFKLLIITA